MRHTICVFANFLSLAPLSMYKNRSMIRQRENVSHIYLMDVVYVIFGHLPGPHFLGAMSRLFSHWLFQSTKN